MDSLFAEIKSNTGVYGSAIHSTDGFLSRGDLPSMFRKQKLLDFANSIRRLAHLGNDDGGFQGMEFSYDQSMVVLRFISNNDLLMTFCTPDADVQLIHLQQNVLIPEFQEMLAQPREEPTPAPPVPAMKQKNPSKKKTPLMFRGVAYSD